MPAVDDHTSPTNYIEMLFRFRLGELVVQICKSSDRIETPYLMLRVDKLCSDIAKTKYGLAVHASLGGVQLVDKIHMGRYKMASNHKEMLDFVDSTLWYQVKM